MTPDQIAGLVLIFLILIVFSLFLYHYQVTWIPPNQKPKEFKKPKYILVPCDCDHEMVCPNGRRPEDTRCTIWVEDHRDA